MAGTSCNPGVAPSNSRRTTPSMWRHSEFHTTVGVSSLIIPQKRSEANTKQRQQGQRFCAKLRRSDAQHLRPPRQIHTVVFLTVFLTAAYLTVFLTLGLLSYRFRDTRRRTSFGANNTNDPNFHSPIGEESLGKRAGSLGDHEAHESSGQERVQGAAGQDSALAGSRHRSDCNKKPKFKASSAGCCVLQTCVLQDWMASK